MFQVLLVVDPNKSVQHEQFKPNDNEQNNNESALTHHNNTTFYGRIHLFRRAYYDHPNTTNHSASHTISTISSQLCCLAIPKRISTLLFLYSTYLYIQKTNKSPTHLVQNITPKSSLKEILHALNILFFQRVINTETRQHSLLITFDNENCARIFYEARNGTYFIANSSKSNPNTNNEIVHLVYVSKVSEHLITQQQQHNYNTLKPLNHLLSSNANTISGSSTDVSNSSYIELPSKCIVCLLKLDTSITDIVATTQNRKFRPILIKSNSNEKNTSDISTNCTNTSDSKVSDRKVDSDTNNHTNSNATKPMLATCLWGEIRCKVCKLLATVRNSSNQSNSSISPSNMNSSASKVVCGVNQCNVNGGVREAIWVCLLCDHIGCGRSHSLHAYKHYEQSRHNFCIELQNGIIWDYIGDGYIHRVHGRDIDELNQTNFYFNFNPQTNEYEYNHSSTDTYTEYASANSEDELEQINDGNSNEFSINDLLIPSATNSPIPFESNINTVGTSSSNHTGSNPMISYDDESEEMLQTKLLSIHQYYNELLTNALQSQYKYLSETIDQYKTSQNHKLIDIEERKRELTEQNSVLSSQLEIQSAETRQTEKIMSKKLQLVNAQKSDNQFLKDLYMQLALDEKKANKEKNDNGNNNNNTATTSATGNINKKSAGTNSNSNSDTKVSSLQSKVILDKDRRIAALQREIADIMADIDKYTAKQEKRSE